MDKIVINVKEVSDNRIFGLVHSRGSFSGAHFLAEEKNGVKKVIYVGQDAMLCEEIDPYGFSIEMVPSCWSKDGGLVNRIIKN